MAKNKGKHNKDRNDGPVDPEDQDMDEQFVDAGGRAVEWFENNAAKVAMGVGLVLLASVVWVVWDWQKGRKAKAATDGFVDVLLTQTQTVTPALEGEETPPPADGDAFTSHQQRAEAVLEKLAAVKGEGSIPAAIRLAEGHAHMEAGQHEQAALAFREAGAAEAPAALRAQAMEGVAYALEAKAVASKDDSAKKAGLDEALRAFEDLSGITGRENLSLYHQGRILAELGRKDDAIAKFKGLLEKEPGTLQDSIEDRLFALESGEVKEPPAKAAAPTKAPVKVQDDGVDPASEPKPTKDKVDKDDKADKGAQ